MFESFGKLIENTFIKFSFPKFFSLLSIFLVVILMLIGLEYYTHYGYYLRLENKVDLLEKLNSISNENIESKPELNSIYEELVEELEKDNYGNLSIQNFGTFFSSNLVNKIWSALCIPFLMTIVGLFSTDKKGTKSFLGGMLFFATISLLFGLLIPSFEIIKINVGINIFFSLLVFFVVSKYYN